MKYISTLHYITQDLTNRSHQEQVELACAGGADWVQLRVKNKTGNELLTIANEVKEICDAYKVSLIINDHVAIAQQIGATGVHLGKTDMSAVEARAILGPKAIIGGTANSLADALLLLQQPIDYIGLGPFRFTTTKTQLAPVMGLSGIADIVKALPITIPIIAIGGITLADVETLMESGIHGIAVSSAINLAENPTAITQQFIVKLS